MTSVGHFIPDAEAKTSPHVIAAYVDAYTDVGDLVVDPFCQPSTLVTEAVALGRRAVATNFAPLDALRTRQALSRPSAREVNAATTRLSDSLKLGVSLREHVERLYRATCSHCREVAIADYFIWERDLDVPKRVSYRCPACGDAGTRDCDDSDASVLQEVKPRGLHYWYVLDRVARHEDDGRQFAASLLELYTSRNLYVLANLVLRIEDLFAGSTVLEFLRHVVLICLEQGSKLNAVPGEPPSPRGTQLRPPPRFVERNVWRLFDQVAHQLVEQQPRPQVPLSESVGDVVAGTLGRAPAAYVGHMSVRHLVQELPPAGVRLVLSHPIPLGRTRWAMPYLWTGWLYGHEEAALLWPLAKRQASDWHWYRRAMQATLQALKKTLTSDGHIIFVGQNKGLAYHEALALAAAGAGLRLESVLYHPCEPEGATEPFAGLRGDYRLAWAQGPPVPPWPMAPDELVEKVSEAAVAGAEDILNQRGEPASFGRLHFAIWKALAQRGLLQRLLVTEDPGSFSLEPLREQIRTALEEEVDRTFMQLWEDEEGTGTCLWWLLQPSEDSTPLSEQVERMAHETLEAVETIGTMQFMQTVYSHFPGGLTPDTEWVRACLESYGRQVSSMEWALRDEDRPEQCDAARKVILQTLEDLGQRLGYEVHTGTDGFDVQWVQAGRDTLGFVMLDSAALSHLTEIPPPGGTDGMRMFAVIPLARQDLLRLRLARSKHLRKQLASKGWRFIRDLDLHEWALEPEIVLADLDSLTGLEPLAAQDRTQLSLM